MRRELDGGIEAVGARIFDPEALDRCEVELDACLSQGNIAPGFSDAAGVRQLVDAVDEEQRSVFHSDVAIVGERWDEVSDEPLSPVSRVLLPQQNLALQPIPATRPVFVRPATAEGEVGPPAREKRVERALEHTSAAEPVVVEAKPVDPVPARELRLALETLGIAEIVETELGGELRLVVPLEPGPCSGDVRPVGEPLAPPEIVLRDRVELG